jgi:hypothetical protein
MTMKWDSSGLEAAVRRAAMRGVIRGTQAVLAEGVRLINSPPKTGRIYRRRGVKHQASAPGQPPAGDTGQLAGRVEPTYDHAALTGRVNFNSAHALPLELGTEKMAPRPFARVALANKLPEIEADVAEEIRAELS